MKENIKNKDEGKIRQLKQTLKKTFFFLLYKNVRDNKEKLL